MLLKWLVLPRFFDELAQITKLTNYLSRNIDQSIQKLLFIQLHLSISMLNCSKDIIYHSSMIFRQYEIYLRFLLKFQYHIVCIRPTYNRDPIKPAPLNFSNEGNLLSNKARIFHTTVWKILAHRDCKVETWFTLVTNIYSLVFTR